MQRNRSAKAGFLRRAQHAWHQPVHQRIATARLLADINARLDQAEKQADETLAALKEMAAARQ